MKVHQSAFVLDLVIDKRLTNCNVNVIPMKVGSSIKMTDPEDYDKTNHHTYQKFVGKLMYLLCGTIPDIAFVVGQLSRHNTDLRKRYLQAIKRVVRYLKGTTERGLIFG